MIFMNNCEKEKYKDIFETAKKIYECPDITDDEKIVRIILVGTMLLDNTNPKVMLPKLKESEDERMWELIKKYAHSNISDVVLNADHITREQLESWLEKKSASVKLSEEEQNRVAKGVLSNCAMSFINYLDAHTYEGKMCVSNGECEDIENAFHNAMWDRLHRYYCKFIEKQGERKQNITNLISDLENYFATTTKEQQEKDWDEIKNWEKKYFNRDSNINQKPVDKVEPKFKVGDWIVSNNGEPRVFRIKKRGWPDSIISSSLGNHVASTFTLDKQYHLWTIKDAKDGDVLYSERGGGVESIHLVSGWKKVDGENALCSVYTYRIEDDEIITGGLGAIWWHGVQDPFFPATKEQRDLLFSKMKEAGYEWDGEKKELKKIEQKPTWSEEDEMLCQRLIEDQENIRSSEVISDLKEMYCKRISWLKSLRQRMKGE